MWYWVGLVEIALTVRFTFALIFIAAYHLLISHGIATFFKKQTSKLQHLALYSSAIHNINLES